METGKQYAIKETSIPENNIISLEKALERYEQSSKDVKKIDVGNEKDRLLHYLEAYKKSKNRLITRILTAVVYYFAVTNILLSGINLINEHKDDTYSNVKYVYYETDSIKGKTDANKCDELTVTHDVYYDKLIVYEASPNPDFFNVYVYDMSGIKFSSPTDAFSYDYSHLEPVSRDIVETSRYSKKYKNGFKKYEQYDIYEVSVHSLYSLYIFLLILSEFILEFVKLPIVGYHIGYISTFKELIQLIKNLQYHKSNYVSEKNKINDFIEKSLESIKLNQDYANRFTELYNENINLLNDPTILYAKFEELRDDILFNSKLDELNKLQKTIK